MEHVTTWHIGGKDRVEFNGKLYSLRLEQETDALGGMMGIPAERYRLVLIPLKGDEGIEC